MPAQAAVCPQPASPAPIAFTGVNDFIICINTEPRTNATGDAIDLSTIGNDHYIYLYNSGTLSAANAGANARGIDTSTTGANSPIDIVNTGDINATGANAISIYAGSTGGNSRDIMNSGDLTTFANADNGFGIYALTTGGVGSSPIKIENSGNIDVVSLKTAATSLRLWGRAPSPTALEASRQAPAAPTVHSRS